MQRMVERDKNHPSVILWSLGQRERVGRPGSRRWPTGRGPTTPPGRSTTRARSRRQRRLSQMYPTHEAVDAIGGASDGPPYVVCEYAHAMGNGPGGLAEYMELFGATRAARAGSSGSGSTTRFPRADVGWALRRRLRRGRPRRQLHRRRAALPGPRRPRPGCSSSRRSTSRCRSARGSGGGVRVENGFLFRDLGHLSFLVVAGGRGRRGRVGRVARRLAPGGRGGRPRVARAARDRRRDLADRARRARRRRTVGRGRPRGRVGTGPDRARAARRGAASTRARRGARRRVARVARRGARRSARVARGAATPAASGDALTLGAGVFDAAQRRARPPRRRRRSTSPRASISGARRPTTTSRSSARSGARTGSTGSPSGRSPCAATRTG